MYSPTQTAYHEELSVAIPLKEWLLLFVKHIGHQDRLPLCLPVCPVMRFIIYPVEVQHKCYINFMSNNPKY